jgi:ubiquinone/menaquinone biosynthesis C-methylase UbiE
MIARARDHGARLGNAEFRVSSGRDLAGIGDASVDLVLAWFVLQHVPNSEDVLGYVRETGRVLRPGGKALLHLQTSRNAGDHARRWLERRLFYLLPLGMRLAMMSSGATSLEREFAARFPVWRGSFVRRSTAERVAREAGLTIVSAEQMTDRYTVYTLARNGSDNR